MELGELYSLKT